MSIGDYTFTLLDHIDDLSALDLSDAFLASDRDGPIRFATVAVDSKSGPQTTTRVALLDLAAGIDGRLNGVTFSLNLSPADDPLSIIGQPVMTAQRSPATSGGSPIRFGVEGEQVIGFAGERAIFTLAREAEVDLYVADMAHSEIVNTQWNEGEEQAAEHRLATLSQLVIGPGLYDMTLMSDSAQRMLNDLRAPSVTRYPRPLVNYLAARYIMLCTIAREHPPQSLALLTGELLEAHSFGLKGAPKDYAKLAEARRLHRENPAMSAAEIARRVKVSAPTMSVWAKKGYLA